MKPEPSRRRVGSGWKCRYLLRYGRGRLRPCKNTASEVWQNFGANFIELGLCPRHVLIMERFFPDVKILEPDAARGQQG